MDVEKKNIVNKQTPLPHTISFFRLLNFVLIKGVFVKAGYEKFHRINLSLSYSLHSEGTFKIKKKISIGSNETATFYNQRMC